MIVDMHQKNHKLSPMVDDMIAQVGYEDSNSGKCKIIAGYHAPGASYLCVAYDTNIDLLHYGLCAMCCFNTSPLPV